MKRIIKTNVAQAFWCALDNKGAKYEQAEVLRRGETKLVTISWFDLLLEGGIQLPEEKEKPSGNAQPRPGGDIQLPEEKEIMRKPLVMLITGPPGSGKTTLAFELCYRLARSENLDSSAGRFSLFFSTDCQTKRVIECAKHFGYENANDFILPYEGRPPDISAVTVCGQEHFEEWTTKEEQIENLVGLGKILLAKIFGLQGELPLKLDTLGQPLPDGLKDALAIVAVDNLNNVPSDKQEKFFKKIIEGVPQAKLIIFVAESPLPQQPSRSWEYASDILIEMGSSSVRGYSIRTMKIVKARYQNHVWGEHQLKIYPKQDLQVHEDMSTTELMRRSHPYRTEGGIFIYPSIHYHLSQYKRRSPVPDKKPADTRLKALDEMLDGGLPRGRCTALIGERGGHKSHLGYLHLLHRIVEANEAGLVISLRDDEQLTQRAMARILRQEFRDYSTLTDEALLAKLDDWEKNDQLEILYFHPGYITPNEFFHRVLMSIYRMKRSMRQREFTVMFNSIDQVGARFPLCAHEDIFVPGIIEALSGEGATSVFIAVDEKGQPLEQYGLLPMADVVLGFQRERFRFEDYFRHLDGARKLSSKTGKFGAQVRSIQARNQGATVDEIVLQVLRFAGGQRAGRRGILELVNSPKESLYEKAGLHFTELV